MTRKLPATDVVIVGLGWTGSILADELTRAGLSVVAIERGPWRDTATDFPTTYAPDELRYHIRHDLFLRPAQQTMTFTASAASQVLTFLSQGGPDGLPPFVFLDGVSLVEQTPEPSSLVCACLGFSGLIAAWRLRNKRA